jgi:UDP-2,4-diacetamido-2,4,6-trideoxy-beta-L-altropyranose hydrolase
MDRQLIIRADATQKIGTGHLMRCLALAQAWSAEGGRVTFVSHCDSEALSQRIREEGYGLVLLERPHPEPGDLNTVIRFLGGLKDHPLPTWVVLDGYHFDGYYQKSIKNSGVKLLVIDDYNHMPGYHADILLNQNIGSERLPYTYDSKTVALLGTTYALLRREFLDWKGFIEGHDYQNRNILLTMGGVDSENITLKSIKAVQHAGLKDTEIDIVMGPSNPNVDEVKLEIERAAKAKTIDPLCYHLHKNPNMPEIMAKAGLAISSGGSTCWELCFFGVPSILIVAAENQRGIVSGLAQVGVALSLGWHADIHEFELSSELRSLFHDTEKRRFMSRLARALVDGKGCGRVMKMMKWVESDPRHVNIELRKATGDDAFQLWRLANDPDVRCNSFSPEPIPYDQHVRWFDAKLKSNDTIIYVMEVSKVILAQIRYDNKGTTAEISYAVAPAFRGRGLGCRILKTTWEDACRELGVENTLGIVKKSNKSSVFSFIKAGFIILKNELHSGCECIFFEKKTSLQWPQG